MKVITGTAKGRTLEAPEGLHTRPTKQQVKEAIFSTIQFELEGAYVLDLFAGSGQMGIEALSRGAASVVFVDNYRLSQTIIRRNLAHTKLEDNAHVVGDNVQSFLQTYPNPVDIAFLDPPYTEGLMQLILPTVASKMKDSGAIICEVQRKEEMPLEIGSFVLYREYIYGKTKVVLYRASQSA